MKEAGYTFSVIQPEADEQYPADLEPTNVPRYLAEKKAKSIAHKLSGQEIIMTSDTVVILQNKLMNKPGGRQEAIQMLTDLSGKTHTVITAVCLMDKYKMVCFDDRTEVTFKKLTQEEIAYYVDQYKPYDKAGAYGAQDWIGMVGIEKIEGAYFTVMGLPMHQVYIHLRDF